MQQSRAPSGTRFSYLFSARKRWLIEPLSGYFTYPAHERWARKAIRTVPVLERHDRILKVRHLLDKQHLSAFFDTDLNMLVTRFDEIGIAGYAGAVINRAI